jgi:hypothetical protein
MKKFRITNLKLREISTVDRPAQTPAVVALIKRQGEDEVTYDTILKSAAAVAKGDKPAHSRADYEAALLKRAAVLAKEQGVTPEQALSRNLSSDPELRDLGTAYEHANAALHAASLPNRAAA